jgi:HTH-type transcriptional regulator / antitoxin HigA
MNTYAEVFPPGEFLKDELEARNWSQTEFAEIIGRPVRLVNEIIAGKKSITPETALQLEASLGTSAELWMNLESQYQLSKVRQSESVIQRKARLYELFPVREMTKRSWVGDSEDIEVLENEFLKFYCLPSLDSSPTLAHAAKRTSYEGVSWLQWSWLFRVKHIAESFVVPKYNRQKLIDSLPAIRSLMSAPEESRKVPRILNEAGIRFVVVEALPGSKIDGACLWLDDNQPVIALSGRLDRIDNFWFVLRHEIEHLIHEHGKETRMMLDEEICESVTSNEIAEEKIANEAAAQFAVTDFEIDNYIARVNPYVFARQRVLGFAARLGVHPGVVVGRLHKKLEQRGQTDSYKFLREYLVKIRHLFTQAAPVDGWGNVYPSK